ncbi:class I adenylate-forming enzyme family protein [Nocardia pseudobrasiliensis]|uniref:Long-chain acyl-CoA synthetase n=1 Tax=Nocardia pseudobrasiliensis TaxID=45979 RepID=A0A370I823_9NOCA|nr:AMP-binding protein [Nocardia pseudobrasiliensis]RDI66886.1 long-chain acyl-CoA synthetase [Nocardia pseudobrasiliensis]
MDDYEISTWPVGLPRSLEYPEVAVGAILAGSARRFGDRVAFRYRERALSYAELWDAARRMAEGLRDNGVRPGARVAVSMLNCLEFPIAYYGIQLAGATFVPVNPLLPADRIAAQVRDAEAVMTVSAAEVAQLCSAASGAGSMVEMDTRDALSHIAYTGGTTGLPKGVELTHYNVVCNVIQHACWHHGAVPALDDDGGLVLDQIGTAEQWPVRVGTGLAVSVLPPFHAMGTLAGMSIPILAGMTVVLHDSFDAAAYLAEVERFGATYILGAPAMHHRLLRCPDLPIRDLSSVRAVGSGGAPLPVETFHALLRTFPRAVLCEGYGLSEITMGATNPPANTSGLRKPGSVGVAMFDTEIQVVADDGEPLPPGARGEVRIRGPQVMRGYHRRPEATAEVLRDGWFHTGDIGVLDRDGYLSIVDRGKDVLLHNGYNVYPRELEELLLAQPGVAAAAVVGRPHRESGELPVAFVVALPEARPDAAALMAGVNARVAPYQRLREVRFLDRLPVSPAGKIVKRDLRKLLE